MFGTKAAKVSNAIKDFENMAQLTATALGNLDKNECSEISIAASVATVLRGLGVDKITAYAAGLKVAGYIGHDIANLYWQDGTVTNKTVALVSAVSTANMMIQTKKVDADTMKLAEGLFKNKEG